MVTRKIGKRNPAIDAHPGTSVREVLTTIKKVIRTDFGGKDQTKIISQRLTGAGVPVTSDTIRAYRTGAERTRDTIKTYIEPQVGWLRRVLGL